MKKINAYKRNIFSNVRPFLLFIFILFVSIGYSAMSTPMNIKGTAYFRVSDWVRITSINLSGATSGGGENYNSKYSKNEVISSVSLPNSSSTVTYQITIKNFSEKYAYIKSVKNTQYSNSGISYTLNGCAVDQTLAPGETITGTITFSYKNGVTSNKNLASVIEFEFAELISSDANLTNLQVVNYSLTPPFTSDHNSYAVTMEETSAQIIVTTSSDKATVTGDGTFNLSWGHNIRNVEVKAEDGTTNVYSVDINNIRPTAPVIQIDSSNYTADKHVVSVKTAGTARSQVDHYEYYVSSTNSTPNDNVTVTGTTSGNTDITTSGTNYIFYRTVSKKGNKSVWSNSVQSNIDTQGPYLNVSAADTYSGSTATITFTYTATDTESGMGSSSIYYKATDDSSYQLLSGTTVTGTSGKTYQYYITGKDQVENPTTSEVKTLKLKTYSQDGGKCDYTYGSYTSTTTNDVASCTAQEATTTGTTYTTCALGNWSTSPSSSSSVDSCTPVAQSSTGTSYTTCTLDSSWTSSGSSNVNSCTESETTTSKVTCSTNSWNKGTSYVNSCTASGSSSSNTQYVTCSTNSFSPSPNSYSNCSYTTSCSASEGNTTKVTCESGYYKIGCSGGAISYNKTGKCDCGNTCTKTSGYKKKCNFSRKSVYTKYTYTRASKYSKTTYYKKYTKKVYPRLYNKTVYTRSKTANTCWHD